MKKTIMSMAGVAAIALTLSACGSAPSDGSSSSSATDDSSASAEATDADTDAAAGDIDTNYKACLVSDSGGFDDRSFNESAKAGVDKAKAELGIQINEVESKDDSDYGPNIDSLISDGCSLIIGVGFNLEPAVQAAAKANPDIDFALIDSAFNDASTQETIEIDNAKPILFNTAEAAFLAGYAAAGMSESKAVGTWGGLPIPSVQIFMDGFADGADQYGKDNSDDTVRVVGWNTATQQGTFVGGFTNQTDGTATTKAQIDDGVDVVMPVAGGSGVGAIAPLKDAKGMLVWVDVDGYDNSGLNINDIQLTSVLKEIEQAVFDTVKEAASGQFTSAPYIGTLANGGVGIAPWHDFEDKVPDELKQKIDDYKQQIIDGTYTVESPNTPKS